MTWIDVGAATVDAAEVAYVEDVRPAHRTVFAAGMKSVVYLRSGKWLFARFARRAIIRRVKTATHADA